MIKICALLILVLLIGGCTSKVEDPLMIQQDIQDEISQESQKQDLEYLREVDSIKVWYLTDYIAILDHPDLMKEIRKIPDHYIEETYEGYESYRVYDILLDEHTIHVYSILAASHFKIDDDDQMYALTSEMKNLFERIRQYPILLEVDEQIAHESIDVKDSNINSIEDLVQLGIKDDVGYTTVVFGGVPSLVTGYDLENNLYIVKSLDKNNLQFEYLYYDWEKDVAYNDTCEYLREENHYQGECSERIKTALQAHCDNFLHDFFQMDEEIFGLEVDEFIQNNTNKTN